MCRATLQEFKNRYGSAGPRRPGRRRILSAFSRAQVSVGLRLLSYPQLPALIISALAYADPIVAVAQTKDVAAMELMDIGQLQVHIENFDQAVGVVSQLARSTAAQTVECRGTCFFSNSSKDVIWSCGPGRICRIHCLAVPPAGDCN